MREYLTIFLVAVAVTYLLAVLAREVALRLSAVARVRDRDVHDVPIPYFGGVAMYGGLVAAYLVARSLPFLSSSSPQVLEDARTVLVAGGMMCALGVVDDVVELDALTKFGGQVLAAGYMVLNGVQLYYVYLPGDVGALIIDPAQAALATVFLVVATVNAVNFIDGLDGLAAGVVGLGALGFFLFSYRLASVSNETVAVAAALLCASLAGVCVGFISHNFHPAAMFMGDSGSMLIGIMLAGSALSLTGYFPPAALADSTSAGAAPASLLLVLLPVLLPVSILIVPFVDLLLAVVRRTLRGQSPFAPDKQHLHHRLLEYGHSHRRAVLVMWLWAALISLGGVAVMLNPSRTVLVGFVLWLAVTVVLTFVVPRVERPAWTHSDDYHPLPPR